MDAEAPGVHERADLACGEDARDGAERCLLEIANLSDEAQSTTLRITAGEPAEELQQTPLSLAPLETRRIILDIKDGTPALGAQLGPDELEIDNRVILLPAAAKPMRVDVQIQNKALREIVEKAVRVAPGTEISSTDPHLFITDREGLRPDGVGAPGRCDEGFAWQCRNVFRRVGARCSN